MVNDEKRVAVSDTGRRVGEHHPRARLTDADVDHIRTLYEEGAVGYKTLGKVFGVSWQTVRDICTFARRNTPPARWRRK